MKTTKENFIRLFSSLFVLLLFCGTIKAADSTYYFTSFGGDSNQKLYVYSSLDGVNFSLFDFPGFGGPTGVLRDPALFYYNNKYYIAFTIQSWTTNSTAFAIASSSNLISWTTIATVDCGIPNTDFTWAPDWFVDSSKIYLIVNIKTSGSSFKPYIYTANDSTLTSWSAPVDMGIGTNHIDAFVVKTDSTYHCFCKDESAKNIVRFTSTSLTGPWTKKNNLWSGYEGACLIKQDSIWRIYIDHYSTGGGLFSATSADLNTWSSLTNLNFGRHGSCLKTVTTDGIPVTNILVSPVADTIEIQEKIQIIPTIKPSNATVDSVTWSSNKNTIAIVDSVGTITGIAAGSAVITARTLDGNKRATCTIVVVSDSATSVKQIKTPDDISIYPNPVDGKQLTIKGLTEKSIVRIVDINGHVVKEQSVIGDQIIQIDIFLSSGEYFVQIIGSQNTIVKKILII